MSSVRAYQFCCRVAEYYNSIIELISVATWCCGFWHGNTNCYIISNNENYIHLLSETKTLTCLFLCPCLYTSNLEICLPKFHQFGKDTWMFYLRQVLVYSLCTLGVGKLFPSYLTYLLTYLLTHSMVQDIIWKADRHSACQKISCFLMEPEGSSPRSHKPATGPYLEPAESSSPQRSLSP
jgi:hypothetical protein